MGPVARSAPPNSRFLIPQNSTNNHCYVGGLLPANSKPTILFPKTWGRKSLFHKKITSVHRLCIAGACKCSQRSTFVANYPGKHDKNFSAGSLHFTLRAKHLHGTFIFQSLQQCKAVGPHSAPFRTVGFLKDKWQKYL